MKKKSKPIKLLLTSLAASVGVAAGPVTVARSNIIETNATSYFNHFGAGGWGSVIGVCGCAISLIFGAISCADTNSIKGKLNTIIDTLNDINAKVDVINNKIDKIASTLAKEFMTIKTEFSEMKVRDDLTAIRAFNKTIFEDYQDQLDVAINKMFLNFSRYSTYAYAKNVYQIDQSFVLEIGDITGKYISIKGEDVEEAIEAAEPYSLEKQEEWIRDVSTRILNKYMLNEGLFESSGLKAALQKRRDIGFTDDSFKEAFSNGFYNYLKNEFKRVIFQGGELADYVSNLITDFKTYCRSLNDPLDSPLLRQYDIFYNTFCFQKDTYYLSSTGERRNLGIDLGYGYLLNLLRFAAFTIEVSEISESVTADKMNDLVNTFIETFKHLISITTDFYKVDENGNPYDNYCYFTKCPIVVGNNILTMSGNNFITAEISSSKIDLEGDESGYSLGTLEIHEDTEHPYRMDKDQLSYLSIMASEMPMLIGEERPTFKDYLDDVLNTELTGNLYISSNKASDLNLSDAYLMNYYAFGQNGNNYIYGNAPDELADNQIYVNDTGYNDIDSLSNDKFNYHQEIRGDYFNLTTGQVEEDESLYAAAMYYKGNKNYDDLGFFSSSYVMGTENEATVDDDMWGGSKGDKPFVDNVATMTIESQTIDGSTKTSKYSIDINYNLQSLNLVTDAKYGKAKFDNSPFQVGFDNKIINAAIEEVNKNLSEDEKIPKYKVNNNENPFWFGYELTIPSNEIAACRDYLYNDLLSPENRANTLIDIYNQYKSFAADFNESYSKIIDNPYKNTLYTEIDLSDKELDYAVNSVLDGIEVMNELGLDTKGFVAPSENATNITLLNSVKPQISKRFAYDSGYKRVFATNDCEYITMPVLAYTERGEEHFYELPSLLSPLIKTKDIKINLPVNSKTQTRVACQFAYDSNLSAYGIAQSKIIDSIRSKNNEYYVSFTMHSFGAFSRYSYESYVPSEYTLVEGLDPTCSASGYKYALKDQNDKYYSEPGVKIGDGSLNKYQDWISEGGAGYLPAYKNHQFETLVNYEFDELTKKFNVILQCKHCESTTTSVQVNAVFVTDKDATCEEAEKGHYVGLCKTDTGDTILLQSDMYSHGEAAGHNLVHINEIPATCEQMGIKEHYRCLDCGKCFEDALGTCPLSEVKIPAINHAHKIHHDAVDPTQTIAGNYEYWECPDCGQLFLDIDCTLKVTPQEVVIPELSYQYNKVNQVLPTHYTSGHSSYYYCPQTDKYYYDAQGVDEIEDFEAWISKGGEGYLEKEPCIFDGPVSYVMDGDQCTASRQCIYPLCKEIEQETVTAKFVVDTPATCTTNAKGHYVAEFENEDFGVYTTPANSTELEGTALGHEFGQYTCTWDGKVCTVTGVCSHCNKQVSLSKEGTVVIDSVATCTSNAVGHYEVVFNIAGLGKQSSPSMTIENTALGHHYENGECIRCHAQDPNKELEANNKALTKGLIVACTIGGFALASSLALAIYLVISKKKKRVI